MLRRHENWIGLNWIEWLVRHKNALIQSHCPHNASFCFRNDSKKKCDPMFNFPNSMVFLHRAPKKVSYDWKISNVNRSISNSIQFDSIQYFSVSLQKSYRVCCIDLPNLSVFFRRFISKAKHISIKVFRINRSISFDLRNVERPIQHQKLKLIV